MATIVIADASVLIALGQLDQLRLLRELFSEVLIPPAVRREVAPSLPTLPAWIQTRALHSPPHARVASSTLDADETEAICLALETKADRILLDDLPARRLATSLGLAVVGTAGVLFSAKQNGFIVAVRPSLDALRLKGFRLRDEVYEAVLIAAGESVDER